MDEFRTNILKEVREVMHREEQHESGLKTWQGGETKGFEVSFEGIRRGVPIQSGVIGNILISQDGGFEALLTAYIVKNHLRSIVCSFSVTPNSSLAAHISSSLSPLSLAVTSSLTVTHLLMIPEVRQRILADLQPKHVAFLGQTCKTARVIVTGPSVDASFWKEHLKKEFGAEKVRETIAKNRTFHGVYCEEKMKASTSRAAAAAAAANRMEDRLRDPQFDPLRVPPRINPYNPYNPDAEYFVPQGGILPPGHRPLGDPFPGLFGGPGGNGNPDLNPLAGGLQREIFGPPRGGHGHPGQPFMRGGPPGGGGGGFI